MQWHGTAKVLLELWELAEQNLWGRILPVCHCQCLRCKSISLHFNPFWPRYKKWTFFVVRQCAWSLFLKLLLKIFFFIDFKTQVHCNKGLCWRKWKFGQSSHAATMHLRLEPVLMAMIWKLPIFVALSLSTFAQAAGPGEILTDWFRWEKRARLIFRRIFVSFPK